MKNILFVFGTRPEAIKMAPVINTFNLSRKFKTTVAVTAQHREMLDQVLEVFGIIPDYDLDLMSNNQTLNDLTSKILNGISKLLDKMKPDLIFVQGDTTTTFSAALAGFYKQIPVAHIEAGLRTHSLYSPFPEEINRKMTSSIATFHFPPTEKSAKNLKAEGVEAKKILITGNTVIDALLSISSRIDSNPNKYKEYYKSNFGIDFERNKTVLVTGHRRESFGLGFENICNAIREISQDRNTQIIYPVHLNPNVQEPVNRLLGNENNIYLIPPQDYIPFIFLMKNAYVILTDSGGVQEEAPSLGKPVLVMRETTERMEGVASGTARLIGTDCQKIIENTQILLNDQDKYHEMACAINPYGDGKSSEKILYYISQNL